MNVTRAKSRSGFTLVELLVVIAIIATLVSMLAPALGRAKRKARMIEETSAGRQLLTAAHMYSDDHGDRVFPGYVTDPFVKDDKGGMLRFPENTRYPWRLSPYLAQSFETIYCADNRKKLEEIRRFSREEYVYAASVFPSLGINSYFIGGNDTEFPAAEANRVFGAGTVVTRNSEMVAPSMLMMFLSARSKLSGAEANGYYQVTPPAIANRLWASTWRDDLEPMRWGFVAPRYNKRAVAAVIDGHVEALNLSGMQDMRRWCNRATEPNFLLGK